MTSADLKTFTPSQLELLYHSPFPQQAMPQGQFVGHFLARIDSSGGRNLFHRLWQGVLFDLLPYGLSFDGAGNGTWYFLDSRLQTGEFSITPGPSRFRETQCLRLTYEPAQLPGPVKNLLYDELKWITPDLILGLGGMNFEKGEGDQFWFCLTPAR